MDLKNQRRLAASILKCGLNRVYMNPEWTEDISGAVTKEDVRRLIKAGAIFAKQKVGISRGRTRIRLEQKAKGRRRGQGSRRGAKYARFPRKERWIQTIRPIRELLAQYRKDGVLDKHQYREFYRLAKGGVFKNKSHLMLHLRTKGILKEKEKTEKKVKLKTVAKVKKIKPKIEETKPEVTTEEKGKETKMEVKQEVKPVMPVTKTVEKAKEEISEKKEGEQTGQKVVKKVVKKVARVPVKDIQDKGSE